MSDVFLLPDPGEGLTEADIVAWKVAAGDTVTVNQILVEVETAKSLVELPSPHAGTIAELLVAEGDTVAVGTPIVRFGSAAGSGDAGGAPAAEVAPAAAVGSGAAGGADSSAASAGAGDSSDASDSGDSGATLVGYGAVASSSKRRPRKPGAVAPAGAGASAPAAQPEAQPASQPSAQSAAQAAAGQAAAAPNGSRPLAKPPVRKLAKEQGVDLRTVAATGARGEVTRADLRAHLEGRATAQATGQTGAAVAGAAGAATVGAGATGTSAAGAPADGVREETIPVKGVQKAMAAAMVSSAFTAPHVSIGVEVDVTPMMDLVRRLREEQALGDVRVSPLLFIAQAVIRAAQRHPRMNARLDDDVMTVRHYVNLGIAAATDRGLIVPNIKDAHRMGLQELGAAIGDLVSVARSGRTTPAAQSGGTITITNVGVFGVDWGTPIINPGESAIVAAGQVQQKPWVVDGAIVPREVMTIVVSADHRVVDGETMSRFLRDVADVLEDPIRLLF